ncbi:hypothetical protein T265_01879 [Opisthorchis viverrini]|uniref:Uncharacterized protein n=1 Tax=Opisthorchis viverrini TaxID=6198 RepID=A0A075AIN5_OPIVI|nr:hypothetical protein T265_01879 [Opisthorchis viverrini]KER31944.1 hypothetical protein T265_01879 [Opisthorchis viverrini]
MGEHEAFYGEQGFGRTFADRTAVGTRPNNDNCSGNVFSVSDLPCLRVGTSGDLGISDVFREISFSSAIPVSGTLSTDPVSWVSGLSFDFIDSVPPEVADAVPEYAHLPDLRFSSCDFVYDQEMFDSEISEMLRDNVEPEIVTHRTFFDDGDQLYLSEQLVLARDSMTGANTLPVVNVEGFGQDRLVEDILDIPVVDSKTDNDATYGHANH